MKSLHQSIKNVLKEGKPPALERRAILEAEDVDINALAAGAADEAPEAPAAEAPEAPEVEEKPIMKAGKEEKPDYAVHCSKDGAESVELLSKKQLEDFIHENGTKCIVKLYELGKEAKVPTVKVKV